MKRPFAIVVALLATAVVFAGLVHAVLVAAHGSAIGPLGAIIAGVLAAANRGLNVAVATGGPGTGNGVVGGAAAFVLGLAAAAVGCIALARSRRTALKSGRFS